MLYWCVIGAPQRVEGLTNLNSAGRRSSQNGSQDRRSTLLDGLRLILGRRGGTRRGRHFGGGGGGSAERAGVCLPDGHSFFFFWRKLDVQVQSCVRDRGMWRLWKAEWYVPASGLTTSWPLTVHTINTPRYLTTTPRCRDNDDLHHSNLSSSVYISHGGCVFNLGIIN